MPKGNTVNEKAALVSSLLRARGWSINDLAEAAGLGFDATRFILYRYQVSPRRAWKIERVLNAAIWTEPQRFRNLSLASDFLGVDFVTVGFHELRKAAANRGVKATRRISKKADLLVCVLAHLAASASSNEKTTN